MDRDNIKGKYMTNEIVDSLIKYKDEAYAKFTNKLIKSSYIIIGCRLPNIKLLAKKFAENNNLQIFYQNDYKYFEEIMLKGFMIGYIKENDEQHLLRLKEFIPYIDNWSVCDSVVMNCKFIKKNTKYYYCFLKDLLTNKSTYYIRFGVVMSLAYYIQTQYIDEIIDLIKDIKNNDYYVQMAIAWFISWCLIKDFDKYLYLISNKLFNKTINNKSIQKCKDSFRITSIQKQTLSKYIIK